MQNLGTITSSNDIATKGYVDSTRDFGFSSGIVLPIMVTLVTEAKIVEVMSDV